MKKKIPKILIIWLIIMIPIHFHLATQLDTVTYNGFGVDIDGNIYVGEWPYIKVYSPNGEELRQISSETSRGYEFCIVNGDTIYIDLGDYFFIKNLNGDILEKIAITDENRHGLPRIVRRTCVLPDGTTYIWRSPWFRMTVYRLDGREKVPVYQSPMSHYRVVLLEIFYCLSNAVMIPVIVRRWKKLNPSPEEKKALNDESMKTAQELTPIYSHRTRQEQSGNIKPPDFKEQWKSIPKWMLPAAIVFFGGCIPLMWLAASTSGDMQRYYRIAFLAWAIICCTVITILLMRPRKK